MNQNLTKLFYILSVSLALSSGAVMAESTYGYSSAGTGTVTATARVSLNVTVPKLILLKVGTASATVDTLSWTSATSIPSTPTAATNGNNAAIDWDGTAPTITLTNPAALNVAAWTNAATTSNLTCSVDAWNAAGGPANSDFTVTSGGTLAHPGANLGACAPTNFTKNSVVTGTWTYALGGTPSTWSAGVYTTTVTYTATGI
jgi:hypothetical protein